LWWPDTFVCFPHDLERILSDIRNEILKKNKENNGSITCNRNNDERDVTKTTSVL
jgi:hypothetical protein